MRIQAHHDKARGCQARTVGAKPLAVTIYFHALARLTRICHGLLAAWTQRTALTALRSVGGSSRSAATLRSASVAMYHADSTLCPFATKSHEGSGLSGCPGFGGRFTERRLSGREDRTVTCCAVMCRCISPAHQRHGGGDGKARCRQAARVFVVWYSPLFSRGSRRISQSIYASAHFFFNRNYSGIWAVCFLSQRRKERRAKSWPHPGPHGGSRENLTLPLFLAPFAP